MIFAMAKEYALNLKRENHQIFENPELLKEGSV
jgi:hypothetical protein